MHKQIMIPLLISIAMASCTNMGPIPPSAAHEACAEISDSHLLGQIERLIGSNPSLNNSDIRVEINNGSVHVSGFISDANKKTVVTQMIESVAGVKSIENALVIKRPRTNDFAHKLRQVALDAEITSRVRSALTSAGIDVANMTVRTDEGHVVITGRVASASEREMVTTLASQVEHVSGVQNQLNIASA